MSALVVVTLVAVLSASCLGLEASRLAVLTLEVPLVVRQVQSHSVLEQLLQVQDL
jgi:hypothetical protein|tara:strand:- start:349 stop:513 length:165 start_codon:yes stop_codon:yes gene_type:complete